MQTDVGAWIWLVGVLAGCVALGVLLAYGTIMWRQARQDPANRASRDSATRELYREEEHRNSS